MGKAQRFEGLSPNQQKVFEQVATGNDLGHHPKTLESLVKKGYLIEREEVLGGRFPVRIKQYDVPVAVHWRWCEWCKGIEERPKIEKPDVEKAVTIEPDPRQMILPGVKV